jgi:hypothetical protein
MTPNSVKQPPKAWDAEMLLCKEPLEILLRGDMEELLLKSNQNSKDMSAVSAMQVTFWGQG